MLARFLLRERGSAGTITNEKWRYGPGSLEGPQHLHEQPWKGRYMIVSFKAMFVAVSIVFALSICSASPATAQPQCGPRDKIVAALSKNYKETPVAIGVTQGGGLIEVLTSPDGKTFSILITAPDGTSCLVSSGQGWRGAPERISGEAL